MERLNHIPSPGGHTALNIEASVLNNVDIKGLCTVDLIDRFLSFTSCMKKDGNISLQATWYIVAVVVIFNVS